MARLARPYWFRAEGALVPWAEIAERQRARRGVEVELDPRLEEERKRALEERPIEVHLRWSCADLLGVPFTPFTVWIRPPRDELRDVEARVIDRGDDLFLRWGFTAAIIEVSCDVVDPSRAVALFASRGAGSLRDTVGATAVRSTGGRVTVLLRTSGATRAVLVNGTNPVVRCRSLADVVDDEGWEPFELVGLPVDDPWSSTAYDTSAQGLVAAPSSPVDAALERLMRGGPPIGWGPVTETGRVAPLWEPPDPKLLVEEIRSELLPRIEGLYAPGFVPPEQRALSHSPPIAPPQQGGRTSSLQTTATLPPLALLSLPASSDPFLALATGFGTAYAVEQMAGDQVAVGRADFLVTAPYDDTPARMGPVEMAAFVPTPDPHGALPAPAGLESERNGLVQPERRDEPWRETVKVSWNRVPTTAALGRPTGIAFARIEPATTPIAISLLPPRDAGGWRPLLPVPDGPPGSEGAAKNALVDAAAVIPLGSGGRSVAYAVAVDDVFGVWSRWEDVFYTGDEPRPPPPRILSLDLRSQYAGSSTCPAELKIECSVDWADRTPSELELVCAFYPMASAVTPPPPNLSPTGPAPAGGFLRSLTLPFTGDALPSPPVEHLDSAGEEAVTPGTMQGQQGRRYRVTLSVPTLDFSSAPRWGVQVWGRTSLVALPGPGPWSPDPLHPAITAAASPVPAAPLPPPQPPGVPMGSAPDAQGRSHARVAWSLPAGADVATVIVWEVAETALRQAAGLPTRAAEGTIPGWRLAALRTAYDAMTPARRQSIFRRVQKLPGTAREADVALPRGSTDIHLFAVTTVTSTGVESPWPAGPTPHEHLRAVMAPRLRRPSAPALRAVVGTSGSVTLSLSSGSRVPVSRFKLFRTRSELAARSAETMGPAFATVTAMAPPASTPPDPGTGELTYTASATETFTASWDDWFVRAVAVPVDEVPPEAVRGQPSAPSEPLTVTVLPDTLPDLAPLTAEVWGAAHDGVVVHSSTSAPVRPVSLGSHRLLGDVDGSPLAPTALEEIPEDAATPPAGAAPGPAVMRGARESGHSPLAVWFTRPVAADPVDVTLRLVDPLGRVTEQAITVPGWVPPPPVTLELLDVRRIAGRGALLTLRSDAPVDASPSYVLEFVATPRWFPSPPAPRPRRGGFPPPTPLPASPLFPLPGFAIPVSASWELDDIPLRGAPFSTTAVIQAVRTTTSSPFQYSVLVRITMLFHFRAAMVAPDGARTEVSATVA